MRADLFRELPYLFGEHLTLVLVSLCLALLIGIPAGILLAYHARAQHWIFGATNIIQSIPSLALFGFLIPVPLIGGIGFRTVILALVLYALLPILRNTVAGIMEIDSGIRDSAVAMGMTRLQLLRYVELPLALTHLMAGIRIATVSTIGTATIAAAIGGGGLGVFIFRGIATVDMPQVLAGAVPAALLALAADGALGWIEQRLRPV